MENNNRESISKEHYELLVTALCARIALEILPQRSAESVSFDQLTPVNLHPDSNVAVLYSTLDDLIGRNLGKIIMDVGFDSAFSSKLTLGFGESVRFATNEGELSDIFNILDNYVVKGNLRALD